MFVIILTQTYTLKFRVSLSLKLSSLRCASSKHQQVARKQGGNVVGWN